MVQAVRRFHEASLAAGKHMCSFQRHPDMVGAPAAPPEDFATQTAEQRKEQAKARAEARNRNKTADHARAANGDSDDGEMMMAYEIKNFQDRDENVSQDQEEISLPEENFSRISLDDVARHPWVTSVRGVHSKDPMVAVDLSAHMHFLLKAST